MRSVAKAALLAGFTLAGLTSAIAAEPAPLPPPYAGVYQPQGVDEIGFWREDDERERRLATSPLVIRDEKLSAYVKGVLCSAVGDDRCNSTRIYILREPTFNATMSANGIMRVYSGLLLRMRSEAELASILGHEFGHFEKRHVVNQFQAGRRGTDILAWAGLLLSMSPSYDARRTYDSLQLTVFGDLYRYGRNQEREADLLGLGYMNQSQLRPQAASEVWQNLMGEVEASARMKGLKKPNFNAVAFTASHPPEGERAVYLSELALPDAETRDDGADRYRRALASWMPVFLDDQIKLNDFGASEYIIESLARDGWTAPLLLARGELYRKRGHPRDLVNASTFYAEAIAADENLAAAYRGLGLSKMKLNEVTEGRAALAKYLELYPDAPDGKMIRLMLPAEDAL